MSFASAIMVHRRDTIAFVALLVVLLSICIFFPDPTFLSLTTVALVWLSVNMAWNLVLGYAGIFSFGQIAFFSVGAYSSGLANHHLGLSPFLSTPLGMLGGAIAALLIGMAALRLRGIYVALITLAFHELLRTLISTDYSGLTGGPNGLPVERYLPGAPIVWQAQVNFFIAWAILAVVGLALIRLLKSPFAVALVACRDAEHVASARGVARKQYQTAAFLFSGAVAGLAGGFYAHFVGVVAPTIISFALVMNLFAMIIIGGLGTFWGPVLGTICITVATTYLQGAVPQYQSLVIAIALLVILLFLPGGLVSILRARKSVSVEGTRA